MEVFGLTCAGCGSTDVDFNTETRKVTCNQCGKVEYYSRAQLGATGKIVIAKDNAIKFFREGNLPGAREFAVGVLNVMQDNAAALFIVAYCDEFVEGQAGAMEGFFRRTDPMPLESDEVKDLMALFEDKLPNLRDFEVQVVTLVVKNLQSPDDRARLSEFIDRVCPYCILHYASEDFMTPEREDFYRDVAGHCDVPKTCLALLRGIREIPSSPWKAGSFAMRARAMYFLEHYVEPVGRVVSAMRDGRFKPKFLQAYAQEHEKYLAAMSQSA